MPQPVMKRSGLASTIQVFLPFTPYRSRLPGRLQLFPAGLAR